MAFQRKENITVVRVAGFESIFSTPDPLGTEVQTGRLNVQLVMSDGSMQVLSFDLLLRLQDDAAGLQHLQNLAALRDYIRTRLDNEVLPL